MNVGVNSVIIAVLVGIVSIVIIDIAIESETDAEAIQQLQANGYTVGGQWVAVPAGLTCNSLAVTLYGIAAAGDDPTVFFGTTGNDVIYIDTDGEGLPDKSWVFGDEGNDTICINATDDAMVWAGAGDDWVTGNNGEDWLKGQNGVDTLNGAGAGDHLQGGQGNDILSGGGSDDTLQGDEGNDTLNGDGGDDVLLGNDDDDALQGGAGTDICDGGIGTDTEAGTPGNCETLLNVP